MVKNVKVGCNSNIKTVSFFWFLKKLDGKKIFSMFFLEMISKIFEFSFILDQSQVCSSNGLGVRACQTLTYYFAERFFFQSNHRNEHGNDFTYSFVISKQIKLEYPATSH